MGRSWEYDDEQIEGEPQLVHNEVVPGKVPRGSAVQYYGNATPGKRASTSRLNEMVLARSPVPGSEQPNNISRPVRDALTSEQGAPLADANKWSSSVGADVSHARVVTGPRASAAANAMGARAFTVGHRVFFGDDSYSPGSSGGDSLFQHELVHVAQQRDATMPAIDDLRVTSPSDGVEHEARAQEHTAAPRRVGRAMIARDDPPNNVSARGYFDENHFEFYEACVNNLIHRQLPNPQFTFWMWGRNDAFVNRALYELGQQSNNHGAMFDLVADHAHTTINNARDAVNGSGPREWKPNVGIAFANLIWAKLVEATQRLGPQFVAAAWRVFQRVPPDRREFTHSFRIPAGEMVPSRRIDPAVIKGFRVGQLCLNWEILSREGGSEYADAHTQQLRDIREWQFEASNHTWTWIRVSDPPDATAEEAAKLLYGKPELSRSIVAASPRFGFDLALLTDSIRSQWTEHIRNTPEDSAAAGTLNAVPGAFRHIAEHGGQPPIDADTEMIRSGLSVEGLPPQGNADQAVLAQSAGGETGASPSEVEARTRVCLALLDEIEADATGVEGFAADTTTAAVRDRLSYRRQQFATGDPAEVMRWDAHSADQYDVLTAAADGVRLAATQYRRYAPMQEDGTRVSLAEYARGPILRVLDAYYRAAVVSELPATGQQRLEGAREQQQLYPFEMMEGVLTACRRQLHDVQAGETSREFEGDDAAELQQQEAVLTERLMALRGLLVTDPDEAMRQMNDLITEIVEFQDFVGLVASLGTIWEEWHFLLTHESSLWAMISSKGDRYRAARADLMVWRDEYFGTYLDMKYAHGRQEKEAARARLQSLRDRGGEFQADIQRISQLIEDEEERERWVTLGATIVAMIGIAVVTMGVGAYVEGALLVGAGWGATTGGTIAAGIVGAGVEAGTFTAITTAIFDDDPTIGGVLTQFLSNWALFGVLKGMSAMIEGAAAAYAARTGSRLAEPIGVGTDIVANLAVNIGLSLRDAEQQAQAAGRELTDEEKRAIVGENLAVLIGTLIAARAGRDFLAHVRRTGSESWVGRLVALDGARAQLRARARNVSEGGALEEARSLLGRDHEVLQEEIETLREMEGWARENPSAARRAGIDPEAVGDLRAMSERAADAGERMNISTQLEPAGGNVFLTSHFDNVVSRFEGLGDQVVRSRDPARPDVRSAEVTQPNGERLRIIEKVAGTEVSPAEMAGHGEGHTGEGHGGEGARPRIRELNTSQLSNAEQASARWQTEGLETDPRAAELMADPEFREHYARWMEMPNRLERHGRTWHVNFPPDTPGRVQAMIRSVVKGGNITLTTTAASITERLHTEFPDVPPDPSSPQWQAARDRLVSAFGAENIARFEQAATQMPGDAGRAELDARVHDVLTADALGHLRAAFNGSQIYLTGSIAQTRKSLSAVGDVDVIIVAPEGTPLANRIAMERRAASMRLQTSPEHRQALQEANLPVAESLEVDAKVMTPEEFAGWSLVGEQRRLDNHLRATGERRTPLRQLRIDVEAQPRTEGGMDTALQQGFSGTDVHNHLLGVVDNTYFVNHPALGDGSAVRLFDQIWERFHFRPRNQTADQRAAPPPLQTTIPDSWAVARDAHADLTRMREANATPEALEARAQEAVDRLLAASDNTSFDSAYEVRDELIKAHIDPDSPIYRNFVRDSIAALAREGVQYSEQSVSLNKMDNRMPSEAELRDIQRQLAAEGLSSDMRFLAMLETTSLAPEQAGRETRFSQEQIQDRFNSQLGRLRNILRRGDVQGVDIAAPERFNFDEQGMANFESVYRLVQEASAQRGRPLVLRPHVGEGYHEPGAAHADDASHVATARHNLELLIAKLEALHHTGDAAVDGVIIRFGHATHATPEQLIRMRELGVIAEANISSNLATGSVARLSEHPLLYNLYYNVRTMLATDAQGVMTTTLPREYQLARRQINRFRNGDFKLEVDGREIGFGDLDSTTQRRFSERQLIEWAEEYRAAIRRGDTTDTARNTQTVEHRPVPPSRHHRRHEDDHD